MRGRRFSVLSVGLAAATSVSFAGVAISPAVARVPAAAPARQPIASGSPRTPSLSVPVDPALTRLDWAGGTPAGGYTAGKPDYVASDAAVPHGRNASTASSSMTDPSAPAVLRAAASTSGATEFPAPGVFLVPSQFTTSPSVRREAAGALDAGHGVDVLFGGRGTSTYYNDTWVFDGVNWVAKSPTSKPSVREGSAMAYDPDTGTTILFGGYNGSTYFNDTWSWNGSNWAHLSPAGSPPARRLAMMAYSPALGEMVLFGGVGASGELADTWTFDGSTWTDVTSSPSPSARANAGFTYDPSSSDLLLYGGENGAGANVLGDTWTYTASGWTQLSPAHYPGVRAGMGFAYDAALGHVVLGAGTDGGSDHRDFWLWVGADWQQGVQPDFANPRHDFVLVPDAGHGQLLGFGGISGSTVFGDTGVIDWGELGTPKNATFLTHPVYDRSSYGVNVYNGNLVIAADDLSVAGVGVGFSLQRRWSGLGGYNNWTGYGWELTNGFDTWWAGLPDGSVLLSGVRGLADMLYFRKSGSTFTTPPGLNATLAATGGGYTLTFNASREKLTFNASGELTGDADRNGNHITYSWSSGQPSGITDSQGRSYSVTVTGGRLTKITDPSGRYVQYTAAGGHLTQVRDGAGALTNYSYTSNDAIDGIEDPNGNTTVPGYLGLMTSITDPQSTANEVTYGYAAPDSGIGAWGKTTVTDQNGHATVYQSQYAGQVVKATDALGHSRKATFNPTATS